MWDISLYLWDISLILFIRFSIFLHVDLVYIFVKFLPKFFIFGGADENRNVFQILLAYCWNIRMHLLDISPVFSILLWLLIGSKNVFADVFQFSQSVYLFPFLVLSH
jgi:hypothetical protein